MKENLMQKFGVTTLSALVLAAGLGTVAMAPAQADMGYNRHAPGAYGPGYAPGPGHAGYDGYDRSVPGRSPYGRPLALNGYRDMGPRHFYSPGATYGGPSHSSTITGNPCYRDTLNGRVCT
ncbi:MAG: hypothetical protein KIT16_03965 [Rhodospirillaceae bacterium]|nr:hypothetical protein [Rhodospirillaceae bacterium]